MDRGSTKDISKCFQDIRNQTREQWLSKYKEKDMDMTKYAGSESDWLKAADIKGKNVSVVIESVGEIHFDAKEGQSAQDKATLKFQGKDKGVVLNATNTNTLIEAYGADSDGWVGKEVGLNTKEYEGFADGIVIVILDTEFDDSIPF